MKLLKLIPLFLLFQCSMNSADIRRGEYLDKAKETTVEDFFEKINSFDSKRISQFGNPF